MSKRIAISVTNDIRYDQRMQKTARSLQSFGYQVTIIGRIKGKREAFSSSYFKKHRFSMLFSKGKLFYIEYNLRLFLHLLFNTYDELCAVDLDTILPNVFVSKIKGIPLIYDAHEYFTQVPEVVERPKVQKIWKAIERYSIPKCHKIYTVSDSIAKLFEQEYQKPCEVIYNFPYALKSRDFVKNESFTAIYQGDFNEGRGIDIAIESKKDWEGSLWLAGDGLERQKLEQIAQNQGVKDIVFLGYVSPEALTDITSKCQIGLNVLENKGLNYYYSLANKFFDYIQCGAIPICSDFPEYRKFFEEYACCILITDYSAQAITKVILELQNDKLRYSELLKNCDIAAQFLTWEKQEDKLRSIYI